MGELATLSAVAALPNLLSAFRRARKGKRDREEVAVFELNLELELFSMSRSLLDGTYQPGAYRTFWVHDPKRRFISAAPFRDRVLHQALCHVIGPAFEAEFHECSFACRRGKGTHRALRAASRWTRSRRYVLHADIRRFFPSIDHQILVESIAARLNDSALINLCRQIVDGANQQEPVLDYFPGDDLFTPFNRRRGLPIGNLTSQLFANLYLHSLDDWMVREKRELSYIRFADDFLVFADDSRELWQLVQEIQGHLNALRLRLHAKKTQVHRCSAGFGFLGFRLFPTHRRLLGASLLRRKRKFRQLRKSYSRRRITDQQVTRSVQAWVAHAKHGDTYRLRSKILGELVFSRDAEQGQ